MPERPAFWSRVRGWFGRRAPARPDAGGGPSQPMLVFTDTHLVLAWPERGEEALAWDDIDQIALRTSDGRSSMDGMHIYVIGGRQRLVVPSGMAGGRDLLALIETLETCDVTALDAARAATGDGWYVVWRRNSC